MKTDKTYIFRQLHCNSIFW